MSFLHMDWNVGNSSASTKPMSPAVQVVEMVSLLTQQCHSSPVPRPCSQTAWPGDGTSVALD